MPLSPKRLITYIYPLLLNGTIVPVRYNYWSKCTVTVQIQQVNLEPEAKTKGCEECEKNWRHLDTLKIMFIMRT